jgi:hypothetical protein
MQENMTALMCACQSGYVPVVQELLTFVDRKKKEAQSLEETNEFTLNVNQKCRVSHTYIFSVYLSHKFRSLSLSLSLSFLSLASYSVDLMP